MIYSEHNSPLKRRFYIIYLPARVAWGDLKRVTERLWTEMIVSGILIALNRIDYVRGVMSEWLELLEVQWTDATYKNRETVKVCETSMERRGYDLEV